MTAKPMVRIRNYQTTFPARTSRPYLFVSTPHNGAS